MLKGRFRFKASKRAADVDVLGGKAGERGMFTFGQYKLSITQPSSRWNDRGTLFLRV